MATSKSTTLSSLVVFDNFNIRRHYDEATETWFFAVVDIVAVLIEQSDHQKARKYWNKLSQRLKEEGSQSVTNCHRLKMQAKDGKSYLTDVANIETLLRIIQSIPSKKAEPVKLWLARVGNERIQEISDPALSVDRARENWKKHGRSDKWIQQRMMGQETRNKLTDYWSQHDVKEGEEFAILTNIIHEEWAGLSVKDHKKLKNLKTQNLRDHMSEAELIFTVMRTHYFRHRSEKSVKKRGSHLMSELIPNSSDYRNMKNYNEISENNEWKGKRDKLTEKVIGCAIEVHRQLGPGLLESAYEQCLAYELKLAEIEFQTQVPISVLYKKIKLDCGYRADFLVENSLIIELKSIEQILGIHEAQLITYMKLANAQVGLLINFNVKLLVHGIRRLFPSRCSR